MGMQKLFNRFYAVGILFILQTVSCKSPGENSESAEVIPEPVKVTHPAIGQITNLTELNATSHYLKEHMINAPTSGYITKANCIQGNSVKTGDVLFEIKTREAQALDQTSGDLAANLKGSTIISADVNGYMAEVFHQEGDFVAEGEALASIKETGSLVFILNLPYEWNKHIINQMPVQLELPDLRKITGRINNISPVVDPVSQTQNVYIRISSGNSIPEGLTARVTIPLAIKDNTQIVPRAAVLSNETETEYWVMKMINDSTAIKVMVKPGLQNKDSMEILQPSFSQQDEILISGNFAVPDTVLVSVIR